MISRHLEIEMGLLRSSLNSSTIANCINRPRAYSITSTMDSLVVCVRCSTKVSPNNFFCGNCGAFIILKNGKPPELRPTSELFAPSQYESRLELRHSQHKKTFAQNRRLKPLPMGGLNGISLSAPTVTVVRKYKEPKGAVKSTNDFYSLLSTGKVRYTVSPLSVHEARWLPLRKTMVYVSLVQKINVHIESDTSQRFIRILLQFDPEHVTRKEYANFSFSNRLKESQTLAMLTSIQTKLLLFEHDRTFNLEKINVSDFDEVYCLSSILQRLAERVRYVGNTTPYVKIDSTIICCTPNTSAFVVGYDKIGGAVFEPLVIHTLTTHGNGLSPYFEEMLLNVMTAKLYVISSSGAVIDKLPVRVNVRLVQHTPISALPARISHLVISLTPLSIHDISTQILIFDLSVLACVLPSTAALLHILQSSNCNRTDLLLLVQLLITALRLEKALEGSTYRIQPMPSIGSMKMLDRLKRMSTAAVTIQKQLRMFIQRRKFLHRN